MAIEILRSMSGKNFLMRVIPKIRYLKYLRKVPKLDILKVALLLMIPVWPHVGAAQESNEAHLQRVLQNLKQVKSATYIAEITAIAPGDTSPTFVVQRYYREYMNPSDTFVGAKFMAFALDDTTQLTSCYDGKIRTLIYEEENRMIIDSFKNNRHHPIRPVSAPFFTYAKTLLEYALSTQDPISICSYDLGELIQYTFTIPDTVVEIIGNRMSYTPALYGSHQGDTSRHNLWIRKSDNLPFKCRRDMPHDISIREVRRVEFNQIDMEDLVVSKYFPKNFVIQQYRVGSRSKPSAMVGKKAPLWILQDAEGSVTSLDSIKSKVLMIEFTSITCGPCLAAIGFLKELSTEYNQEDFVLISIETINRSPSAMRRYRNRNKFEYPFLISDRNLLKAYKVGPVPVFMILDEDRVIRYVIGGYGKETTDRKIKLAIESLL